MSCHLCHIHRNRQISLNITIKTTSASCMIVKYVLKKDSKTCTKLCITLLNLINRVKYS